MNKVAGIIYFALFVYTSLESEQKNLLTLSCDCGTASCSTKKISTDIIDSETILIHNCEALKLTAVKELHVSWARKGIEKKLEEFKKLKVLRISNSIVGEFKNHLLHGLNNLEKLLLEGNEIKNLPEFPHLPELKKLFLSNNKIEMIKKATFDSLKSLEILWLENNKIFYINEGAFSGLECLEEINLNRNALRRIQPTIFRNNFNVKEISLNYNEIDNLSTEIFAFNKKLEVLRLHANALRNLKRTIFQNNYALKWIELGENQLQFIDPNVFRNMRQLQFLDLFNNICIDESFPIEMNFVHLLELIKRNCHFLAVYHYELA